MARAVGILDSDRLGERSELSYRTTDLRSVDAGQSVSAESKDARDGPKVRRTVHYDWSLALSLARRPHPTRVSP